MAKDTSQPLTDALVQCEQAVEQLQQENAELRNAAQTFGELAERLNRSQRPAQQVTRLPRSEQS